MPANSFLKISPPNLKDSLFSSRFALLLVSVILFAMLCYGLQTFENTGKKPFLANDTASYFEAIDLFYCHHFEADPLRPFLLPMIVGLPMAWGAKSAVFSWAIALNFCSWLGTLLLIYAAILQLTCRSRVAFVCGVLFATHVGHLLLVHQMLSESVYTFLLTASFYFFIQYVTTKKNMQSGKQSDKNLIKSIFIFVMASLIRATTIFLAVIFALWALSFLFKQKKIVSAFVLALLVALPIGYQGFQMNKKFGTWDISFSPYENIVHYFGAQVEAIPDDWTTFEATKMVEDWKIKINQRGEQLPTNADGSQNWQATKRSAQAEIRQLLIHQPFKTALAYSICVGSNATMPHGFIRKLQNYRQVTYFESLQKAFTLLSALQNILLTLGGALIAGYEFLQYWRQRKQYKFFAHNTLRWIFSIIFVNIILISGFTISEDRYHLVVVPIFLINMAVFYSQKKTERDMENNKLKNNATLL